MIHILTDPGTTNADRLFACGIVGKLPPGDVYWDNLWVHWPKVTCPGCRAALNLDAPKAEKPISGRPGHPGFDEFCRIAATWGYD